MRFNDKIARSVRHQAANDRQTRKTDEEIDDIISEVNTKVAEKQYDFTKSEFFVLSQRRKKRFVKQFKDLYSTESILCQCIKYILDRTFKMRYPNRNKSIKMLFGVLTAIKQMSDFTIVRFDFKDYFNSVSAVYVFEKYIRPKLSDRFEIDLVNEFAEKTKYAYAGFCTSNVIAEIIAKQFDEVLKIDLINKGVIFYERYIDDAVIIFNDHVEVSEIQGTLQNVLEKVFRDKSMNAQTKCKTRLNNNKFNYISRRTMGNVIASFDYLGYEFWIEPQSRTAKIESKIKYGITQSKQDKYNRRVDGFISCFLDQYHSDFNNVELLRHKIAAFTSRVVYKNKKYKSYVWKVKGFITNYGELRYLLDTELIESGTKNFLDNMINDAFNRASVPIPYFIKGSQGKAGYNLLENMKVNKTLLLVEHIGYDYPSLAKLCAQIGKGDTDKNGQKRGYGTLVREYLIETEVGY